RERCKDFGRDMSGKCGEFVKTLLALCQCLIGIALFRNVPLGLCVAFSQKAANSSPSVVLRRTRGNRQWQFSRRGVASIGLGLR
ncbi:MAG: hypothetical protein ORN83_12915, partial [Chthoniobacteraceae bacterium]|nr:hypothetical protein [Chthoniobacteraceae bacterium]